MGEALRALQRRSWGFKAPEEPLPLCLSQALVWLFCTLQQQQLPFGFKAASSAPPYPHHQTQKKGWGVIISSCIRHMGACLRACRASSPLHRTAASRQESIGLISWRVAGRTSPRSSALHGFSTLLWPSRQRAAVSVSGRLYLPAVSVHAAACSSCLSCMWPSIYISWGAVQFGVY